MAMVMGEMISKIQQGRDGAYEDRETPGSRFSEDENPPECNKCLCGISPRAWAVIVAVFDIIRSVSIISYSAHQIFRENFIMGESKDAVVKQVAGTDNVIPFWKRSESRRDVLYPSIIVWSIISLLLSVLLIIGSYKRNSSQLRLWFAYKFSATLASIPLYAWLWLSTDENLQMLFLGGYLASYLAVVFALFVVYLTIQDIFRSRRSLRPEVF